MIESCFTRGKKGETECGDRIVTTEDFIAVIDGVTPKGKRRWAGLSGDQYVAKILEEEIQSLKREAEAPAAINALNGRIARAYEEEGLRYEALPPVERLQACVVMYSNYRREIWSFGDCQFRLASGTYTGSKRVDRLLSDLRSFYVQAQMLGEKEIGKKKGNLKGKELEKEDPGREAILPFLELQLLFANTESEFGYDVLDGGPIHPQHTLVRDVSGEDWIILASDGYPKLFDTLGETERYLQEELAKDPLCIHELKGTKAIAVGAESYDDRSFIKVWI